MQNVSTAYLASLSTSKINIAALIKSKTLLDKAKNFSQVCVITWQRKIGELRCNVVKRNQNLIKY